MRQGSRYRLPGAIALVTALVAGEAARAQAPADAPPFTLDFIATDASGEPLLGLTPEDVRVKVGGRERRVRSLDVVSRPAREGDSEGTPRNIILVVDEATLYGLEPVVKDAVTKLLASLSRRDLVAFSSTRRGGTRTNITYRHETIAAAVDGMVTGPGVLWTCARDMLLSVEELAGSVPPGRSTTIAVISRGSESGASFKGDTESGPCQPRRDELRRAEETISAAQINLHFFTATDMTRSWAFDTIARNTGGSSGLLSWKDAAALERAVAASSQYYRVTFDGDAKAARRPERVDLQVNRPGVKVRTSPTIRIIAAGGDGFELPAN